MTREEFLDVLARLRCAPVGRARLRAPHKPLLLLWLFGRFASTGSTAAAYAEAEEPVSTLINDFGPPVASASAGRQRAAMPFVHLEREIWDLRDSSGAEIGPDAPERGPWLTGRGTVGRLRPGAERLLADPGTLAAAARLLLDLHFTLGLAAMICDAVGLDLAAARSAPRLRPAAIGCGVGAGRHRHHGPDRPGPGRGRSRGALGGGPARSGSHPPGGDLGPARPDPPEGLERLLPGPGGLPGRGTPIPRGACSGGCAGGPNADHPILAAFT